MKQLQNIQHSFDTPLNTVGVTIRKGPKWSDNHTPVGTLLELRLCQGPHHDGVCLPSCEHHGLGLKVGSWYGMMEDLPPALLTLEHSDPFAMLQHIYPGFNGDTYVTALIYLRIA